MRKNLLMGILSSLLAAVIVWFTPLIVEAIRDGSKIEYDWTPQLFADKSSLATSTYSVTGMGFSYTIFVTSQSASNPTFTVSSVTQTYTSSSGLASVVVTSSATTVPKGQLFTDIFYAPAINPQIIVSGLDTSATVYVSIRYGQTRSSTAGQK